MASDRDVNRTCGDQCDFWGRTVVRFHVLTGTAVAVALVISDPVRAEWAVIGEQKTSYTTDALQFSAARRLRFSEDPSLPTALDLEQEQDVIWEPSLEVIRRFASTAGRPELSFKARGFLYTLNPIFNHGDYRLQWRQSVAPGTSLLVDCNRQSGSDPMSRIGILPLHGFR